MSEFNWWLLIVGLVVGGGLVWLILADAQRRESEVSEAELPSEAAWIAETTSGGGDKLDAETAERVLRLHRTYLASLPPDDPLADVDAEPASLPDAQRGAADQAGEVPSAGTTPVWSATEPSPRRR